MATENERALEPQPPPPKPKPRFWVRVLRTAALAAVGFVVLLLVLAMFFEDSFIYFPAKVHPGLEGAPDSMKHPCEEVFFKASDGVKLHGWFVTAENPLATILYFHGNAGNIYGRASWIDQLAGLPADVFAVDYRGYGKSEGKPGEKGLYLDADAAYRWLTEERKIPADRIVVYGKSLGGAPACELALNKPCRGVVLQSTFTNAAAMADRMIPLARFVIRTRFDNLGKIAKIKAPKLIIHSRDDEMIPVWMAEKLHEAAAEPKTLALFEGAGHNDLGWMHGVRILEEFRKFLKD